MMRKSLSSVAGLAILAGAATIAHAEPAHQDRAVVAAKQAIVAKVKTTTISGMADGSVKLNGVPMSADKVTAHTPWTGKRFNSQYVCGQNNIGTTWNINQAMSAFESGLNSYVLNYRFPAWGDQPCSTSYSASQVIQYGTYNNADGTCYSVNATSSNGRYVSNVVVGFNLNAAVFSVCRADTQSRNNVASQATGNALGLANFSSTTSYTASVMNNHFDNVYNFAGGDDRTSLCKLLGICPD